MVAGVQFTEYYRYVNFSFHDKKIREGQEKGAAPGDSSCDVHRERQGRVGRNCGAEPDTFPMIRGGRDTSFDLRGSDTVLPSLFFPSAHARKLPRCGADASAGWLRACRTREGHGGSG